MNDLTTTTCAVALQGVSKRFGTQQIVRDVSLTVAEGETLAVIGPSGCGKSVTMKLMMSLLSPDDGSVSWFGSDVKKLKPVDFQRVQRRFGYLFQMAALFDSLSVFENIVFGLRQKNESNERKLRDVVQDRLRDVGLTEDVARKYPSELSGGMKKRVGLARALALEPDVMFYDEPTTGLDPVTSRRIDDLIADVRDAHDVTSVIVTHDMRTVRRVADRVVMLVPRQELGEDESQVAFDGTVEELAASTSERVREFLGDEFTLEQAAQQNVKVA